MGWKDAPIANSAPKWAQAPAVSGLAKQEQPQVAVEQPKKQSFLGKIGQQWWETYVKPFAEFPQELKDYVQRAEEATIRRQQQKGGANIPVAALTETIQKLVGAPVNAAATIPLKIGMNLAGVAASNVPGYTKLAQKIDPSISAGIGKALEGYEKHVPGDVKNVVDISTVISSILPAGTVSKPIVSSAGKAVSSTIGSIGNKVEGLGKEILGGELKIKQNLAQKGYGRTLAEKKTNILNNISKYKIEDPTGNFIKMGAKTDDLIENTVNESNKILQKLSTGENAIFIDPAAVVERAANKSIDGAALGMTDNIKNEYSNILKDMELRGMVGRQPLNSLVEVKKLLDPDGNLFKTGPYISDADNATRGLRKQMYLDIVEEIGNISPEIKALNKKTKELIDIKSVLDDAASRTTNNKFLGLVQKLTGLGAIGASAIHSPEAAAALGSVLAASKIGEQGRGASALIKTGKGIKKLSDISKQDISISDAIINTRKGLKNVSEKLKQKIPISDAMKRFIGGKSESGSIGQINPQVKSENFKKWTEGAPLVSAENAGKYEFKTGEPVIIQGYHGSPDARFLKDKNYSTFKSQSEILGGIGAKSHAHWFASDVKTAKTYSKDKQAWDYQNSEEGIFNGNVKFKNPLVIDGQGKQWREAQKIGKTSNIINYAQSNGYDGVIIKNVIDTYNTTKNAKPTTTYVTFDPENIKSITENSGVFGKNRNVYGNIKEPLKMLGLTGAGAGAALGAGLMLENNNKKKSMKRIAGSK